MFAVNGFECVPINLGTLFCVRLVSKTGLTTSDINEGHRLLEQMEQRQPKILERDDVLTADTKLITTCWDEYGIKPVIDIRNMWKDVERTRMLRDLENVTYSYRGNVYCHCPVTEKTGIPTPPPKINPVLEK